jgi:hypothetical protein
MVIKDGMPVTPNNKRFSETDKNENDPESKRQAVAFLTQTFGYTLKVPLELQPEMYSKADVTMYENDKPVIIEVEHKNVWEKHGDWQSKGWTTVDVPGRKVRNQA